MSWFIILGDVLSNVFYVLPLRGMIRAFQAKDTQLGITPYFYGAALGNCIAWTVYAHLLADPYMLASVALGLGLSIFYYHVCVLLEAVSSHRFVIVHVCGFGVGVFLSSVVAWVDGHVGLVMFYGILGDTFELIMLLIPLVNVFKGTPVILWIAIMTLVNSGLWGIYGFILGDMKILLPNIVTLVSGAIQIGAWGRAWIYARRLSGETEKMIGDMERSLASSSLTPSLNVNKLSV